jgi:cytochrome P450
VTDLDGLLEQLWTAEEPYPVYAAMRAVGPVLWMPRLERWLVTGHPQAVSLLTDRRTSSDRTRSAEAGSGDEPAFRPRGLPFVDPPVHTRLRSLVQQAFTLRAVERLRPTVARLTDELLDSAAERVEIDLISEVAGPLPAIVLAELLGIPAEDHATFRAWATTVIETIDRSACGWSPTMPTMRGRTSSPTCPGSSPSAATVPRTT